MKRRPRPAIERSAPAPAANECVQAVDGALGFVSRHPWVPRSLAVALLETVESNAAASAEPDRVREMVERAVSELDGERLAVAQFTDRLLDLRNAAVGARGQLASTANR